MNYDYLSPFLGAMIGYGTNWLAIKMIFRPFEEKRVLGVKVPFTPGVIAKEKTRLASKLGNTIANHLLTSDEISKYIKNEETKNLIYSNIEKLLLEHKGNNVGDLLDTLNNDELTKKIIDSIVQNIDKDKLVKNSKDKILNTLHSDVTTSYINKCIEENIDDVITYCVKVLKNSDILDLLNKEIDKIYSKLLEDENSISHYIKDEDFQKGKNYIENNLTNILSKITKYITSESFVEIDKELQEILGKILESTVGPFVLNFISPESIYEKGKAKFVEYVDDENNNEEVLQYLEKFVNFILNTKVSNGINVVNKENIKSCASAGTSYVVENLLENMLKAIASDIVKNNKIDGKVMENIIIKTQFDKYLNETISNYYDDFTNDLKSLENIEKIKNISLENIIKEDKDLIYISKVVGDYVINFINNNVESIINSLNISKIVEDKVNSMALEETEKMVLDVVKKELNTITYLGGVLGFIIGMIPVISKFF